MTDTMTFLRYVTKDRFSHVDAAWLGFVAHLILSGRYVEGVVLATLAALTSGILTGIVKVFSENNRDK